MSQYNMPKKRKRTPRLGETKDAEETSVEKADAEDGRASGHLYTLRALALENGSCPFEEWLKGIKDTVTRQRIQIRLDRIERGNLGDCGPAGEGISEFRLMFGAGYRIYYVCVENTLIILLGGGDKDTQGKDIPLARELWKDNKDDPERYKRDVRR